EPGAGPGQFNLPHGVWIDRRGRVLVCDRENDRVQIFDQAGAYQSSWPTKLIGPAVFYVDADDVVYVPEHNGGLVRLLPLRGGGSGSSPWRGSGWPSGATPASAPATASGATRGATSTSCARARGGALGAS